MKKIIITSIFAAIVAAGFAQNDQTLQTTPKDQEMKTLLGSDVSHGGYGALTMGVTNINGETGMTTGIRGAWVIGHSISLGIAANGFVSDFFWSDRLSSQTGLTGGYGGLLIEPIILPRSPVHVSFPCVIGVGGVANLQRGVWAYNEYDYYASDADVFIVFEPAAEVELNVTRFFRLGIGASYRIVNDLDLFGVSSEALDGLNVGVSIKFGKF
ncbi:MAG: hypothetical protein KKD31_08665 [Bacteroidetes bacterium]|nr:hypothetical protein [Bacteroidota bacterium]